MFSNIIFIINEPHVFIKFIPSCFVVDMTWDSTMPFKHTDSWCATSWLLHERFVADHENAATVWTDVFEPLVPWITFVEENKAAK